MSTQADLRVHRKWRDAPELLTTLRGLFAYGPGDNRATGSLYAPADGQQWPATLADDGPRLLDDLDGLLGVRFEICAFQAYRAGAGCGWHADTPFDAQAVLSLGVARTFGVRPVGGQPEWVSVGQGDLVYMPSGFQAGWQHCVPTEADSIGERCALVFRTVKRS